MAFKPASNAALGISSPGAIDTVASVQVGTRAKFYDDVQGEGDFIYLPGVAALVAGDIVIYDLAPGAQATTRHSNATGTGTGRPVAFATAAALAGQFCWFQIGGIAIVNTTAAQAAGLMNASATAGQVANAADAGDQILNARLSTATGVPAANKAYATIWYPFVQGAIL